MSSITSTSTSPTSSLTPTTKAPLLSTTISVSSTSSSSPCPSDAQTTPTPTLTLNSLPISTGYVTSTSTFSSTNTSPDDDDDYGGDNDDDRDNVSQSSQVLNLLSIALPRTSTVTTMSATATRPSSTRTPRRSYIATPSTGAYNTRYQQPSSTSSASLSSSSASSTTASSSSSTSVYPTHDNNASYNSTYNNSSDLTYNNSSYNSSYNSKAGRRGCPQQFPRKLYDLLEAETPHPSLTHPPPSSASKNARFQLENVPLGTCIAWSLTGKAFQIINGALFTSTLLPRYFKTRKFSSFQRNLNLYGFTKVLKGLDRGCYSNENFWRGGEDFLIDVTKNNKGKRVGGDIEGGVKRKVDDEADDAFVGKGGGKRGRFYVGRQAKQPPPLRGARTRDNTVVRNDVEYEEYEEYQEYQNDDEAVPCSSDSNGGSVGGEKGMDSLSLLALLCEYEM